MAVYDDPQLGRWAAGLHHVLPDVTCKALVPWARLLRRISVPAKLPRTFGIEFLDPSGSLEAAMSTEPVVPESGSLELPVEELLRRVRPLPPHEEMVIEDLDDDEGTAFLAVLEG